MTLENRLVTPEAAEDDERLLSEPDYERAWREFSEFITSVEVSDRWSSGRLKQRDHLIGEITSASMKRHNLTTHLGQLSVKP